LLDLDLCPFHAKLNNFFPLPFLIYLFLQIKGAKHCLILFKREVWDPYNECNDPENNYKHR
jgi:hypothetical protein